MHRLSVSGLAVALALAGCASGPATLTPQELSAARQAGNLEGLYDQYALRLTGQKLTTPAGQQAVAQLNDIGTQLARSLEQDIRGELRQQSTANGLVALPIMDAQLARLPKMQKWSPETHDRLAAELHALRDRTRTRITAQQNQLARFTEDELGQRVAVLDDLALLTGDERYRRESVDVVTTLRRKAEEALKGEQYGEARRALLALQQVSPEDRSLNSQLTRVDARLFEKRFWDSLADDRPDDAYTEFMNLAQAPGFPAILQHLSTSSDDMVAHFIAQAGVALSENRLADAYVRLNQARDLRHQTGGADSPRTPQEEAFLKAVNARYEATSTAGQVGLALGYLKVIERFQPDFPGLRTHLRTTLEATLEAATPKLGTPDFSAPPGHSESASAVAANVTRHMLDKIPHDLRIIEYAPYQANLHGREPAGAQADALARSGLLLVQGKILELRVDTTENLSTKTLRVATGSTSIANPAHEQWAALTESQRATLAEPPRLVMQQEMEDITINLQVTRKVGILEAAYRLVEAATDKVLASGSETARVEYADEGNEGVEIGQFRMPARLASLPADADILQMLTGKISDVIGSKLEQELKNPERRHAEAALRHAENGDAARAAEEQARAFALATLKGQDATQSRLALEEYALKAR